MSTRPLLADSPKTHEAEPIDELAELREELDSLRADFDVLRDGLERDRNRFGKFILGVQTLLGGGNVGAAPSGTSSPLQPPNPAAWQAWKQQLPDSCGKVIDALMVQPLKASQMIALCKLAYPTITAALRILERNGLIEKDGRLIRLKRL